MKNSMANFETNILDNGTIEIKKYTGGDKKVRIPAEIDGKAVTSIGQKAFNDCTSLIYVVIPNSVISIERAAFKGCTSLTSVVIPNSVVSIEWEAFKGCTSLTGIDIPDSITNIGQEAFKGCTSLTSVVIPNSVVSIEWEAFNGCTSLTSVVIPNSITNISETAFPKILDSETNGEKYTKVSNDTNHIIVIAHRGWIFEGYKDTTSTDELKLLDANVVRKWSNGRGIGGLVKEEYKHEYTLDPVGTVRFPKEAIIATIDVEW